ncbi:MAG TPA: CoA transferase [Dehalococcoidia bacterium]|nr:CoA transferase [Dehalococcoidia bacterium]
MTETLLDDLLVIDISRGVAGAYCCLLFRHLGADVVRAEPPGRSRSDDDAPSLHLDAGAKSITLDAAQPEGAALLRRLAERADVLIVDGVLPPGLDYTALSAQNPRLILTRVTPPSSNGDSLFGEYFAGLNAFAATLLPLVNMAILGRGQQVEVDSGECLAAAAFVVDGPGQWPQVEPGEALPLPFKVMGQARGPAPTAPSAGEHNDEVYCGLLGLSGEEMAQLKEKSII